MEANKFHIGWRNIKTGIAVLFCLLICRLMGNDYPIYAGTAAILSMKDTIQNSVNYGITRMKATIIGGVVAVIFLYFDEMLPLNMHNEIMIPLALMITIYICSSLNWKEASGLACVVVLVILLMHRTESDKYLYAVNRVIETLIGILVAIVVNKYIVPPHKNN